MPIINMMDNKAESFPDGAYCLMANTQYGSKTDPIVLYLTHQGLCLEETEHNMRDDSDFYMVIWDQETQAPRKIMFASTRGWTYPCMGSHPDATDEVRQAYDAYLVKQSRMLTAQRIRATRREDQTLAKLAGCSHKAAKRLREASYGKLDGRAYSYILELFKANLRSEFRISLRNQIQAWLRDPNPKFNYPLSSKQTSYLAPSRRY